MISQKLKPYLTWLTYFLLLFFIWTLRYQISTTVFALVLGIVGTMLIFFTEVGYTYRKMGWVKTGSRRLWLKTHIIMGVVGPLIILWHTGLNFYGFAGWLTALTAIVVVSGFIGRYLYRLIPRSIKGQALTLKETQVQADEVASHLKEIRLETEEHPHERRLSKELKQLEKAQTSLARRLQVLDASKATLSKWRAAHVPMTLALFVGILIHVGGILYYGQAWP